MRTKGAKHSQVQLLCLGVLDSWMKIGTNPSLDQTPEEARR